MVASRPLYLGLTLLLLGSTFARPYNSNNPSLYRRMEDPNSNPHKQLWDAFDEAKTATGKSMRAHRDLLDAHRGLIDNVVLEDPVLHNQYHAMHSKQYRLLQAQSRRLNDTPLTLPQYKQVTDMAHISRGNTDPFPYSESPQSPYLQAKRRAEEMKQSRNAIKVYEPV